jgi:hypothetical protein
VEFGWRVHSLLDTWTGKVDNKASIVLAIESAAFAFIVTQTAKGKVFADPGGVGAWVLRLALALLLVAIGLALLVVLPQLDRRQSTKDWAANSIYFGHLRHWDPDELAKQLPDRASHQSEQLAKQMVTMSKIAWRKHVWLQGSLVALTAAVALLLMVAVV